jgi:pimeloyl-ACP methyl ester carboxylesterase
MTITRRRAMAAALAATLGLPAAARAAVAAPEQARGPPSPILLIHGAWHGAWCWAGVTPLLEAAGRQAVAIDMTSLGLDRTPAAQATFQGDVDRIVGALAKLERPAVLVGHGFTGVVISAAAEQAPEKVRHLVYLSAYLPANGESAREMNVHNPLSQVIQAIKGPPEDGAIDLDHQRAMAVFYNDTPPELAVAAAMRLRPQPVATFSGKSALSEPRWGRIPKTFIRCTKDHVVTPAFADWMIARHPELVVKTLDADHSPFLGHPEALSALLAGV